MKIDLHLHTTASDGRLAPEELVRLAAAQGLAVIAITDHDSTEGVAPALAVARSFPSLKVIPGVEIGTDVPHGEVHVLGYFINYRDSELLHTLQRLRNSRQERALKIITKLKQMGIHIEWKRVLELAGGGSVGRPHIAQAMFERSYIPSIREAFLKYIGRNSPAYAEREKMTPEEAVELVVRTGGLPVLAHPADIDNLEEMVLKLKEAGLVGIEAYYNGYSLSTIQRLASLARRYQLIVCGGSDYHGLEESVETPLGGIEVPEEAAEQLFALAARRATLLVS
jgi:hypothetical protein